MCGMLDHYLRQFAGLEEAADTTVEPAGSALQPLRQPLLLLVILDLFAEGKGASNFFSPNQELLHRFARYGAVCGSAEVEDDFAAAFQELEWTDFWDLRPRSNVAASMTGGDRALSRLQSKYFGVRLAAGLCPLLIMQTSRERLRQVLLEACFPPALLDKLRSQHLSEQPSLR